ncbi:MAG TPA: YCF48-related protein, partial [Rudaea sp.]|nr:YCF48-related protein [Rudaea sp.]
DTAAAKVGADESGTQTFTASQLKIGQESTPHFNAIARTGSGALFIVGERGAAFRSRDDGKTWQRLQLPYDGSMFGVIGYAADHVLAFGLRGHAFESTDLGDHWTQVPTGTELSLMGGTVLPDDGAAIVGANGIVLTRAKGGEALTIRVDQPAGTIAEALPLGDSGNLLLAGENGVSTYKPQ